MRWVGRPEGSRNTETSGWPWEEIDGHAYLAPNSPSSCDFPRNGGNRRKWCPLRMGSVPLISLASQAWAGHLLPCAPGSLSRATVVPSWGPHCSWVGSTGSFLIWPHSWPIWRLGALSQKRSWWPALLYGNFPERQSSKPRGGGDWRPWPCPRHSLVGLAATSCMDLEIHLLLEKMQKL